MSIFISPPMPYVLRAVLAPAGVLERPLPWLAGSRVVALPQGLAMVPLTQALREAHGPADRPWLYEKHAETWLPAALAPVLAELSRGGAVAYVEAEYHGGDGEQRCIVWSDGAAQAPEEHSSAVNAALARLGVEAADGMDAFDTVGLGRHRSVEDWLDDESGVPAAAAPPEPGHPPLRRWWRVWG